MRGYRAYPFPLPARMALLTLALTCLCPAQSRPLFDTFDYPQPWSTPPNLYLPQPSPALIEDSPNGFWKKVVWAAGPGWPTVDYLAENATTSNLHGPSRSILSVTPPSGSGPAGGAEILSNRKFGFGSFRARLKASPPTPRGVGVCNAFYFFSPQCELDVEFLSQHLGNPPGTGRVEMVVHDYTYMPGRRVTLVKYVNLPFDPSADFHVYGFDWYPNRVVFFVEDTPVATFRTGDLGRININNVVHYVPVSLPDETNVIHDWIRFNNWTGMSGFTGTPPPTKTDFHVDWVSYTPFYFTSSSSRISAASGGVSDLQIDAGAAQAGALSLILASLSETDRGLINPFLAGGTLPFEFDPILSPLLFNLANRPNFPSFLSVLDGLGQGTASFRLLPGRTPPEAIGAAFHFACITLDPTRNTIQNWSNRLRVVVGP